jgi:hypothetical protein
MADPVRLADQHRARRILGVSVAGRRQTLSSATRSSRRRSERFETAENLFLQSESDGLDKERPE